MRSKLNISIFLCLALNIFLLSSCGNNNQPASQPAETAALPDVRLNDTSAILIRFNFEHFGSYDLATWKLMPKVDQGDVVLDVMTYTKDSIKMDVKESAMGEGMYFLTYELTGSNGKVMKTRDLSFTTASDTESEKLPVTITETVRDYTINPPKQFERKQKTDKLYRELKPLPTAATGAWVESVTEPYFYPEDNN
ncbi:MAG TPA: hypothetical protein DCF33_13805 [Saprospirales bacterium]|nr:hypothetical protein [Saprospirales bacterium]